MAYEIPFTKKKIKLGYITVIKNNGTRKKWKKINGIHKYGK
jgi:hypothetical protein